MIQWDGVSHEYDLTYNPQVVRRRIRSDRVTRRREPKGTEVDNLESAESIAGSETASFRDYIDLLRPVQWVKNVVVFVGPAAGLKLFSVDAFGDALLAFVAFCLAASATYAINDAIDRKADARHPTKRDRPVARGVIGPATAVVCGLFLLFAAMAISTAFLNRSVAVVVGLYFLLTLTYSLVLKRAVLIDVIVIASGFVLRAWAGTLAVGVVTSEWLVACMFTLCLFMGFGKRRCELAMMPDATEAGEHRRTLLQYTPELLNHLITVSAGIAVVLFLIYTMDTTGTPAPFHKQHLFYTLPIVVYSVFRFAMLTELGCFTGPTEIVLKDKAFLASVTVWILAALMIAYQERIFGPDGFEGLVRGAGVN